MQPKNRNSAQGNKPAGSRRWPSAADDDDAEALRRRVEEPEPGERVDEGGGGGSQKKTPAPDLRRLSNREKTLLIDRVEAGVFAQLDDMLARHRAQQLPLPPRPARR